MMVRIEALGHILHFELNKQVEDYDPVITSPAPENSQMPMQVYAEPPTDPVAQRLGFYGKVKQ
jgi:hypothetical protein